MVTKGRLQGDGGVRLNIKFKPGYKRNNKPTSKVEIYLNGILKAKVANVSLEDLVDLQNSINKFLGAYEN